jgi:putative transport protein
MEIDLFEVFSASTVLVVFAAIAAGYLVGNIRIARFELGPTGGVLLCALVFGHYGFEIDPVLQSIGFTLFIYSVGWQAGPQIFNVLGQDGLRYVVLTLFVAVGSVALVVGLAVLAGLDNSLAAGLLAGGLTSTPTLVGAQNAVTSGLAIVPAGGTPDDLIRSISVAYAITYIFGTVGLLLLIKLLPTILRIDLAEEAVRFARERGFGGRGSARVERPILRAYLLDQEDLEDKTLSQIRADIAQKVGTSGSIYKIKRGSKLIVPTPDTVLKQGDKIAFFGSPRQHAEGRKHFQLHEEVLDEDLLDAVVDIAEITITKEKAVNQPLADLGVMQNYGCFLSRITRSQIELPLTPETQLHKGDVMIVSGERSALDKLIADLGSEELKVTETDLVTFAAGIVFGLFLGQITVKLGGIDVGIGNAGGLLVSGILVGYLRANRPTFGRMPAAARFILMELGLMLFMVGVGVNAGGGIVSALGTVGPALFLCGVAVTCVPLIAGYFFGRLVLKMNPAVLLGALTGAMTSTPALGIVQQAAKSTVPALGYAGTYALANVLLTIAGTIIMILH